MECRFLVFLLFLWGFSFSQQLRVGVYTDYEIERILFTYNEGSYKVYGDSVDFGSILSNEFVDISLIGDKIQLSRGVEHLGKFSKILLVSNLPNSSITLTPKGGNVKNRKYQDDFEILPSKKGLSIINAVEMNNYLSGVVESEGGGGRNIEYYKVQAIMCRTYALKNLNRHSAEQFSVCDRVHCQAYHQMLKYTPSIREGVEATDNKILVDDKFELGGTYFHANCGGQTSEAALVWNNNLPYLSTFKDTFCVYTKQSTWEKKIPQQKWADFLVSRYNYPLYDSVYGPMIFTFNQPERMGFFQSPMLGIPLRDLRQEFQLKSTFFSCYPEGLNIVVRGKGVGHGVGLCQEGAMKMAQYGYSYQQIALYYYPGLRLINYHDFLFFRQNHLKPEDF
jgi:stage II sporulation protein D